MFLKAVLFLAVVAIASAQFIATRSSTLHGNGYANGYALPYAYSAYSAPLAYSAYSAPLAYNTAPLAYSTGLPGYGVHPY